MAQANEGAAGVNGAAAVPHQVDEMAVADGAGPNVPVVNGAALPQMDGARVNRAAAAVAGALVAAALLFPPQALVPARVDVDVDVDGILLGPLPTKSNGNCKILPKIVDE